MATRDLERLGATVKAHRLQRYSSRDAAGAAGGITKDTWQRVEEGRPVRESSYMGIEKALGWAIGSCILIAEGGSPVLAGDASSFDSAGAAVERPTAKAVREEAYRAAEAKMPGAPIGEVRAFVDELVEALRRVGAVSDSD
ncbi:hypothetical protein [Streptomyces sp. NPDC093591]|uniref:hypothetical protein n=1 Tax=Streptomyces sp. NPDC093591 TaxID=3366044 RepID=UPI003828C6D1